MMDFSLQYSRIYFKDALIEAELLNVRMFPLSLAAGA
jgi:hypothetical protein